MKQLMAHVFSHALVAASFVCLFLAFLVISVLMCCDQAHKLITQYIHKSHDKDSDSALVQSPNTEL